jgi:hypothetical protein
MKKFILQTFLFTVLVFGILAFALFFLPNKRAKESLLGGLIDKHKLLSKKSSRRLIFVGGSNLSFGLDSKRIADSLKLTVINMGVHGGLGLKYMIEDVKPFIRPGDLIVLAPEYSNYYKRDSFLGNVELVSVLFDIYPEGRRVIDREQWKHLTSFIPQYTMSKLTPGWKKDEVVYKKDSFNKYGDAYKHWTLPNQNVAAAKRSSGKEAVDKEVMTYLKAFASLMERMKTKVLILPPVFQQTSFDNQRSIINKIEASLKDSGLPFYVRPSRYMLSDNFFFNTNYHLNKKGIDIRTALVIEDIRNFNHIRL